MPQLQDSCHRPGRCPFPAGNFRASPVPVFCSCVPRGRDPAGPASGRAGGSASRELARGVQTWSQPLSDPSVLARPAVEMMPKRADVKKKPLTVRASLPS